MRNAAIIALCAITLASCYGGPAGEVVGVYPREDWVQVNPYGMNYIHYGSYTMGPSDQDVPYALTSRSKTVTVPAFYIDIHEISNNEYRQFVYWVRDSLFRDVLQENDFEEYFRTEDEQGRELDRFINKGYVLNWDEPIDWENEDIFDALYDEFYFQGSDRFYDSQEIDTRKLNFKYFWINLQAAALKSGLDFEINEPNQLGQLNSIRSHSDRAQFIIEENTNVYPDTLCWIRDFTYGFNEPLTETYFWHPAYDDYPAVGISWGQAKAFVAWRTQILNEWKTRSGQTFVQDFRLPSEAEWEFASRGGLELAPYPMGWPLHSKHPRLSAGELQAHAR